MARALHLLQLGVAAALWCPVPAAAELIPPTDPALFFSPANWVVNSTLAAAVNPGAYLKFSFSGSGSVALAVEATPCLWSSCMALAYTVDDEPIRIAPGAMHGGTVGPDASIALANAKNTSLDITAVHTVQVFIHHAIQYGNRWRDLGQKPYTDQRQALLLRGVILDSGATVHRSSNLRPKRMIAFGDSITEGINAQCTKGSADAATKTWVQPVAAALNAEFGQVGFGAQGWTVPGNGQVPPFFTPGVEPNSTWDKVYEGAPRSFDNIDYIFVLHATNDGLRAGTVVSDVVASCEAWLHAVRAAAGPATAIFLAVPFGGFGSKNPPVAALPTAFSAYQARTPDLRTFLVDLGAPAAQGLECGGWERDCVGAYGTTTSGASEQGCDGIHPRGGTNATARHGELGAMLVVRAVLALAGQPDLLL